MWHETMVTGLSPVWDTSSYCSPFKIGLGFPIAKLSCQTAPLVRMKRPLVFWPKVSHDASLGRNYCRHPRNTSELGKASKQGRFLFVTRGGKGPSFLRFPDLGFRVAPGLTHENRPGVRIPRSSGGGILAISLTAVATRNDADVLGLTKGDIRVVYTAQEADLKVSEDEQLRRRRIGIANKGRVPWNKGGKHRPETIKLIREKTSLAMKNPQVLAKLKGNSRHPQSDETRSKIGHKVRVKWTIRNKIRGYQERMLRDWRSCVAEAARKGDMWEDEMAWNSFSVISKQLRLEEVAMARAERAKKKEKERVARSSSKSEEHRLKISNAIKSKWEDPEYQFKVRQGMAKSAVSPRSPRPARPRRSPSERGPSSSRPSPSRAVVKGPLDQAFLTAVMAGEKRAQRAQSRQRRSKARADRAAGQAEADISPDAKTRIRKVDLLRRYSSRAQAELYGAMDSEADCTSSNVGSTLEEPSAVEPSEQSTWNGRSALDLKRREASRRAKTLMAEAEKAVKVLEDATDYDDASSGSLADIRKVIDEAAHFIRAADSVNTALDDDYEDNFEPPRRKMSVDYLPPDHRLHEPGHDRANMDPSVDGLYVHDRDRAQDVALGMKASGLAMLDDVKSPHGDEEAEQGGWDSQQMFPGGSVAKSSMTSASSFLDARGRNFRALADAAGRAMFERWQRANTSNVEDERDSVRTF